MRPSSMSWLLVIVQKGQRNTWEIGLPHTATTAGYLSRGEDCMTKLNEAASIPSQLVWNWGGGGGAGGRDPQSCWPRLMRGWSEPLLPVIHLVSVKIEYIITSVPQNKPVKPVFLKCIWFGLVWFVVFWDSVLLCNPGCPGSHSVTRLVSNSGDLPASASLSVGIKGMPHNCLA